MHDPLADLERLEGVPSAVASALAAVDVVLRDRGHRRVTHNQSARALLDAAAASAELTGDSDRWLPGTVRLYAELTELAALVRVAPGQVLARAHVLLARGLVADDLLGRLRADAAVAERMADLTRVLTMPTEASGVVVGAVAHAEIAVVSPFGSGDGVLARAVEHMVLISAGVDPYGLISCEAGHRADPEGYAAALRQYRDEGARGVRVWLQHCALSLARGAAAAGAAAASEP
ncbi:MAG TPA: oxidoreductase [Propionibacteriaceae bacterium]|nr:oxidoreductase [Propionibacteriaceae bacterium]